MKPKSLIESLFLCSLLLFSTASCSKEDDLVGGGGDATIEVETLDASTVTILSATVSMKVNASGLSLKDFDEVGVFYGTQAKITAKDTKVKAANLSGEKIEIKIENINPGTTYYYRGYVIKGGIMTYGPIKNFTTPASSNLIVTGTFDEATHTATATLHCDGIEDQVTEVGFYYSFRDKLDADKDTKVFVKEYPKDGVVTLQFKNVPFGVVNYNAYVKIKGMRYDGTQKKAAGNSIINTSELDLNNYSLTSTLAFSDGYTGLQMGICYSKSNKTPTVGDRTSYVAVLDSTSNTFTATMSRVPFGTVYCRTFVKLGDQVYYGDVTRSFERPMPVGKPVDLGLSVLWADMNLGSTAPEEVGSYYAWGETDEKDTYTQDNYKYYVYVDNGEYRDMYCTKYVTNSTAVVPGTGEMDGLTTLEPEDDAATVNWGSEWFTPSMKDVNELISDCTWTEDSVNGLKCIKVTGPNGSFIHLPSSGIAEGNEIYTYSDEWYAYYWTRTLYSTSMSAAYCLYFDHYYTYDYVIDDDDNIVITGDPIWQEIQRVNSFSRQYGMNIRPVCKKN